MIKLIATDMDGTLLHSDGTMPADFHELLQTLKHNQIIFSAASGRPYLTLIEGFKAYADELLLIADNGAHVVYKGRELAVHTLSSELVHRMIQRARTLSNAYSVVCTTEGAFVESSNRDFLTELEKYYVKYTIVEDLMQLDKRIIKYTVCDLKGAEKHSFPLFKDFEKEAKVCVAGNVWLDAMPLGVHKGSAIKEIQDRLHITFDETMVFGDYLNDAEMMTSAYYSYAMANAHPDLKRLARFEAASNDEDGVTLKINEMLNNDLLPLDEAH